MLTSHFVPLLVVAAVILLIIVCFFIIMYVQMRNNIVLMQRTITDANTSLQLLLSSNIDTLHRSFESKASHIEATNSRSISEVRNIVDERLQHNLNERLSRAFNDLGLQIERLHRNVGEVGGITASIDDLKKVLYNVKTRGIFGEVQLRALLTEALSCEQYEENVEIQKHSNCRVEFAIKLPNQDSENTITYLPIDSKFPFLREYEEFVGESKKQEADIKKFFSQLEKTIIIEAKKIRDKYLMPPFSTDFAIMFIPIEGLYCDILRIPNLIPRIYSNYQIILASPTSLIAILSSIRILFTKIRFSEFSSQMFRLFEEIKHDFIPMHELLEKAHKKIDELSRTFAEIELKGAKIERKIEKITLLS